MSSKTIAVLSPGDMGHGVGRALGVAGHQVITCLEGRSERTRQLAAAAEIRDCPSLGQMLEESDLVLSILPPAAAPDMAAHVAAAMAETGATPPYVDCNAVSPETVRKVGDSIIGAGAPFIDGGIIGLAPGRGPATRFYVSGPDCAAAEWLACDGIEVKSIGPEIGRASAMKMCYAALTKGAFTLHAAVLTAAEAMGLSDELRAEFEFSQTATLARMQAMVPRLPADSARWIGEMEEIARTFAAAGVTPDFHNGAAAVFSLLARTPLAAETRETIDTTRSLEETIRVFARHLPM